MSSLSNLKSSDLEPLFPSESDLSISPLQVLILNNTGIGDDAAPYVGSCEELETLGVASTRFTSRATIQSAATCVGADARLSGWDLFYYWLVQETPKLGCDKLQANTHRRSPTHFRGRSIYCYISFYADVPNRCGRNPKNDGTSQRIWDVASCR
jgi:hypothetical protein